MSGNQAVVIYSGGMDSTVLLYQACATLDVVRALSINYGQRHAKELDAARAICGNLGIEHQVVDLSGMRVLLKGSSQTDPNVRVPHGHYAEESMKLTVVPNRNMLMLACGIAWAISTKSQSVGYAAHAGDHTIYPDCRAEFVTALDAAAQLADWHPVMLWAPFLSLTKAEIAGIGSRLGVPFALTWSCYEGGAVHCGKCGTCVERREAFQIAGLDDSTDYAA